MGFCSQQYLCIDENLNLSCTPPQLKKFQTSSLMDTNQIHLIGKSFDIHGARRQ